MEHGQRLALVAILVAVVGLGAVFAPALTPAPSAELSAPPSASPEQHNSSEPAPPAETTVEELIEPCAAEPPADFADPAGNDSVIGWVDGVWYDEPLAINTTGGVSESALERLSARTLARVEALRCLSAEEGAPTVTVESRAQFSEDRTGGSGGSERRRLFENARLATLLLVGQQQDAVDEQDETEGAAVGGVYDPLRDEITIVTDDPERIQFDEATLAHELGHALQDQQFDLSVFDGRTTDARQGERGLLEGDASLIERRYRTGCLAGAWVEPCLGVTANATNGSASDGADDDPETGASAGPPNWGVYFIQFQPYSDGPAFVERLYERGGWAAVDDRYDDPPQSALPVAKPGPSNVSLADVSVEDRSGEQWERIVRRGRPDYDTVGVAGISAMFLTPSFETGFEENIYPPRSALNVGADGEVNRTNPVNYWHPEVEGWRDDKLYAYTDGGDRHASVWRLAWATPADADQFVRAYTAVLEYRDGTQVSDSLTYTFGPDSAFEMAVSIRPDGDTVTVVTAPTVDALRSVHGG